MTTSSEKIESFTDLFAWQEGHRLVVSIYLFTKTLPRDQLFSLADQLQRAAVSVTSNIAEGFARHTNKDKVHFFYMSLGSIKEIQNQLLICRDVGYIDQLKFQELASQSVTVSKLINGLIKSTRNKTA